MCQGECFQLSLEHFGFLFHYLYPSPIPRLTRCSSMQCSWLKQHQVSISASASYWLLQHDLSLPPKSDSQPSISERSFFFKVGRGPSTSDGFISNLQKVIGSSLKFFFFFWNPRKWPGTPDRDFPLMELRLCLGGSVSHLVSPFISDLNQMSAHSCEGDPGNFFSHFLRLAVYIPHMHANEWCNRSGILSRPLRCSTWL